MRSSIGNVRIGELTHLQSQPGTITGLGMRKIFEILRDCGISLNPYSLEKLNWVVSTAEGSFVKRLCKMLYEEHGLKVPKDKFSLLGDAAMRNQVSEKDYLLNITTDFKWVKGDFGDPDSCLFENGRSLAFDYLNSIGAYLARIFLNVKVEDIQKKDHPLNYLFQPHWPDLYKYVPHGRAVVFPLDIFPAFKDLTTEEQGDMQNSYLVSNGYITSRDTLYVSQLLALTTKAQGFEPLNASLSTGHPGFYVNPSVVLVHNQFKPPQGFTFKLVPPPRLLFPISYRLCELCNGLLTEEDGASENVHKKCGVTCPSCHYIHTMNEHVKGAGCPSCSMGYVLCAICGMYHYDNTQNMYFLSSSTCREESKVFNVCCTCLDNKRTIKCHNKCCGREYIWTGEDKCPVCKENFKINALGLPPLITQEVVEAYPSIQDLGGDLPLFGTDPVIRVKFKSEHVAGMLRQRMELINAVSRKDVKKHE